MEDDDYIYLLVTPFGEYFEDDRGPIVYLSEEDAFMERPNETYSVLRFKIDAIFNGFRSEGKWLPY